MKKKEKDKQMSELSRVLTIGELIDSLKKLPKQAEVRFTDVCGVKEAELYQVSIDVVKGCVLLIGEFLNDDER